MLQNYLTMSHDNAKNKLQELLQSSGFSLPSYISIRDSTSELFGATVIFSCNGTSYSATAPAKYPRKKSAEKAAAEIGFERLCEIIGESLPHMSESSFKGTVLVDAENINVRNLSPIDGIVMYAFSAKLGLGGKAREFQETGLGYPAWIPLIVVDSCVKDAADIALAMYLGANHDTMEEPIVIVSGDAFAEAAVSFAGTLTSKKIIHETSLDFLLKK